MLPVPMRSGQRWPLGLLWVLLAASCQPEAPRYLFARAQRGDVREEVVASGNVSARIKVNVGSQISGTVAQVVGALGQEVRAGQVLAQLDTRMLDAQLMRARATLARAQAERGRAQLNVANTQLVLQRIRKLTEDAMTARVEEESAKLAHDGAWVALHSSDAMVQEAQADVDTATLSRKLATLVSPIDGVIIDRQIVVGQTVAAQFQVATLFTIAQNMNEVVVLAAIDEADMGRVRLGMPVTFGVDAYPGRAFAGALEALRPAPVGFGAPAGAEGAPSGVVTYLAEIGATNGDRALWEGMTAQVHIQTEAHPQVVRVPAAALRFRPEAGAEPPERPGHPEVFVKTAGGKVVARAVQHGLTDGAYWEIVSGLEGTEEVAVAQGRTKSAPRGRRGPF